MKIISYAQNLEDIMLWRTLKKYSFGFYIDIGACEPTTDSVTKLFYENGWRGINIEPIKQKWLRFQEDRSRDINLNVFIEDQKTFKKKCSIDAESRISNEIEEYVLKYTNEKKQIQETAIETDTLTHICETYVSQEINFLRIAVYSRVDLVLQGANFSKFRPWIIVVKIVHPKTQTLINMSYEDLLHKNNYTFVYFDGLNHFYLANEKSDLLKSAFVSPPNYFDNYERYENFLIQKELNSKNECIIQLKNELNAKDLEIESYCQEMFENTRHIGYLTKERQNALNLVHENHTLQELNLNLKNYITALLTSRSWKLATPFRKCAEIIRGFRRRHA